MLPGQNSNTCAHGSIRFESNMPNLIYCRSVHTVWNRIKQLFSSFSHWVSRKTKQIIPNHINTQLKSCVNDYVKKRFDGGKWRKREKKSTISHVCIVQYTLRCTAKIPMELRMVLFTHTKSKRNEEKQFHFSKANILFLWLLKTIGFCMGL